ncbi:glutamyl-tRNA reductase [candidate division LCP-89 bacterium B3_LCP]|uniref:Glutamyl-tRNA reductase n=1 Tax=candidate division LCP-89 bacterium B3_LCP TaxID=2012998 RepID=A0A532V0P3_UNCL8|nr:MAG: glutamyl-tRNA reductase [candidate division LCP-89 bacterium B3_LCP]
MGLSVCGFSHKTASLEDREIFQLGRSELPEACAAYREIAQCEETVVVATCNRVEFYQFTRDKTDHLKAVIEFYKSRGISEVDKLREISYCHHKTTTARHIFRVSAGLESMVLGEDQVFHQLKEAYSAACSVDGPGKILHKLFHLAFQVGKQIRAETNVGSGPRSVPGAALEMLRNRMDGGTPRAALVIGVNEMTEIILDGLARWGIPTYLANRTADKANKLAAPFKAKTLTLDNITSVIGEVDAVFSATSAPGIIVKEEYFDDLDGDNVPVYLIDLAIPRDIDPALGDLPGMVILDLQDMKRFLDHIEQVRAEDVPLAEKMIEEQVSAYSIWRTKLKQETLLLEVHRDLNKMRKVELERFKDGFRLSEHRALDAFSQSLVKNFMRILPEVLEVDETSDKKTKS